MASDASDGAMIERMAGRISPEEGLDAIVAELHSTPDPDFDLILNVGVGSLESLFHSGHEEQLWPRIEELARSDERFRRALRSAWAFNSPMWERRNALLEELGEHRTVTVRFVVEPRTFDDADGFSWRALEVDDTLSSAELADILRSIADHVAPSDY